MRVLHIGKYYPPAPGGIETYLGDLCAGLAEVGVRSHVLAHRFEVSEPKYVEPVPGVCVERVPVAASFCYSLVAPGYPLRLRRAIRRFRPDVVHAHLPNLSAFSCLLPVLNTPLVLHWHADVAWPKDKHLARALYHGYAPLQSLLLRRADLVVATSQAYLDGSAPLAPFRHKCRVVPLGVRAVRVHHPDQETMDAVRERWLGGGGAAHTLIVSAGRFAHYKGFEHLVRAMRDVQGAMLVMVGEGESHSGIRTLVQSLGLGHRIHLAGRLPDAEMHALMAAADIFCLPSIERSEAFGVVLVEAMALGTCCVSTDIPGSAPGWVVQHEQTGLVVPPADESALAAALTRLAANTPLRQQYAHAAHQRYQHLFKLASTIPPLTAVYHEAIASL